MNNVQHMQILTVVLESIIKQPFINIIYLEYYALSADMLEVSFGKSFFESLVMHLHLIM